MLLKAADVCMKAADVRPKADDVFAKSGRCPPRTKAADVENIYFEIFGAKAADAP